MCRRRPRRSRSGLVAAAAAVAGVLTACAPSAVELAFEPTTGASYQYRYDIVASVRRAVDGQPATERSVRSTLYATKEVTGQADGLVSALVELRRDGGPPKFVEVDLDRAGSPDAVRLLETAATDPLGALGLDRLALGGALRLPSQALRPGATWQALVAQPGEPATRGWGRLDRLGVEGGRQVAVVSTEVAIDLAGVDIGGGAVERGTQRTRSTTSYDLGDGAVREAKARSEGRVVVVVPPPAGVQGDPARVVLAYELEVTTTRR